MVEMKYKIREIEPRDNKEIEKVRNRSVQKMNETLPRKMRMEWKNAVK